MVPIILPWIPMVFNCSKVFSVYFVVCLLYIKEDCSCFSFLLKPARIFVVIFDIASIVFLWSFCLDFAVAVISFGVMPAPYICAVVPFIMSGSFPFESVHVPITNFSVPARFPTGDCGPCLPTQRLMWYNFSPSSTFFLDSPTLCIILISPSLNLFLCIDHQQYASDANLISAHIDLINTQEVCNTKK